MPHKLVLLCLLVLMTCNLQAQTCVHTDLSRKFNYAVTKITPSEPGFGHYCKLIIKITDKLHKQPIQKFVLDSSFLESYSFSGCKNVRSYITHKNEQAEVADFDYGDLVIADLNFDGREDFAIKTNNSADAGPFYTYYLQDNQGKFRLSSYLTQQVVFFPDGIDFSRKALLVIGHTMSSRGAERWFKYQPATQKWHRVKKGENF